MFRNLIALALAALLAIVGWVFFNPTDTRGTQGSETAENGAIVAVQVPKLEGLAALGARAFEGKCAACHGVNAGGLEGKGPPLIHMIYRPGHHGDAAIERAARQGARSHHWPFGDMPPVAGITSADIKAIIAYIRTVQQANGIF